MGTELAQPARSAGTEPAYPAVDGGIERLPATRRFDPRRHRRISGLFDLWLETDPDGGLVMPTAPGRHLDARAVADLVRRSGDTADDVRILADDGARYTDMFSEVAGLLGHDVLVSPVGADIRHVTARRAGADPEPDCGDGGAAAPLHAVPLDRVTRRPLDWIVVQPPDLATGLPGWFTVDHGLVRPRTGVVGLPLPDGVALATRADFVTRRAIAQQLGAAADGMVTVAVTARSGGFLVGTYRGTQAVHSGDQLSALLGDLPLYGCDLRLWLTWPSDADEQTRLAEQVGELAETSGATVWTPPPGGSAELVEQSRDLRALDRAGTPAPWQAHRPRYAAGQTGFASTDDGRLMSRLARDRVTVDRPAQPAAPTRHVGAAQHVGPDQHAGPTRHAGAAAPGDGSGDGDGKGPPVAAEEEPGWSPVPVLPRPALVGEGRRVPEYGPPWLPRGQQVNAEEFEAFVPAPGDPARLVSHGVPSAELFLVGFLDARSAPRGSHLLRVRIQPGGAIPVTVLRSHVPARFQHLMRMPDSYLLPAARLDLVRSLGGFHTEKFGRLVSSGVEGGPVRIHSAPGNGSLAGLSHDVRRWPTLGAGRAYALLPAKPARLPRGWLRLHHQPPPARPGRLMVELRVPRGRSIDVSATAGALAGLALVRTPAQRLRTAGVELILGSRSYERVRVERAYRAHEGAWRRDPAVSPGTLSAVVAARQPAAAGAGSDAST
ncbi:hypothetical protein [Micromonospora sp. NBRC 101691]|uniref:hypothetical protein n=1 Tax=Micromonospora sp. NBRC 101691 TaxID=3032198 RepID=UPI0024A04961|nr:hypothetical protein [Micromonospora sp. NBRC 101691]GLY24658.1 hypothetical protein Misp04_43900 [Micromonospora sp. NBRC 101691]